MAALTRLDTSDPQNVDPIRAADLARGALRLPQDMDVTASPLGGGKFSQTFLIEADTSEYVLRIAPPDNLLQLFYEYRMMRQEPGLHRLIQKHTDMRIPSVEAHDFTRQRIARDYLLMNRLPGTPLSEVRGRLSSEQVERILFDVGREIAQLHSIRLRRYGYRGPHRPMEPQSRWDDAFAIMWEKMLDDCVGCTIYTDQDKKLGMKLWHEYRGAFDPLCPCVPCHMDLWVANVLVHQGRFSALFDFDRACYGDPENEFAVAEYCGLTTSAFWEGYGRRPEPTREWAIRRWFYLLYEHQKYIVISVSTRRNNKPMARRYADQCRQSMHSFLRTGRPEF